MGLVRLNGYPQRELFDGKKGQIGLEVSTIIAKKQSVQNDHRVGPVKLTVKYHGVGQEVPLVVIECLINRPPFIGRGASIVNYETLTDDAEVRDQGDLPRVVEDGMPRRNYIPLRIKDDVVDDIVLSWSEGAWGDQMVIPVPEHRRSAVCMPVFTPTDFFCA